MQNKAGFATFIAIALTSSMHQSVRAEDYFDYDAILYKCDPSKATITLEVTKTKSAPRQTQNSVKQSILVAKNAHHESVFRRVTTLKGHTMETTVHMWKPRGSGFGGAFPRWTAIIKRDGKRMYAAAFGHNHNLDLDINKVVIHASDAKINLTWIAEIDNSSHVTDVDSAATLVTDLLIEKLEKAAVGSRTLDPSGNGEK